MTSNTYKKTILILSIGGVLFSGYLSAVKLFSSTCAFNEPCPYFLGYPACWFGFSMFLILFISAVFGIINVSALRRTAIIQLVVSGAGVLFAGYFTIPEIGPLLSGNTNYSLGLPTCSYGLIFFTIIFILAILRLKNYSD